MNESTRMNKQLIIADSLLDDCDTRPKLEINKFSILSGLRISIYVMLTRMVQRKIG